MTVEEQIAEETPTLPPRRLHPASPFIGLVFQLRQLLIPLALSLFIGRGDGFSGFQYGLFLGLPVVIALLQFLGWLRFSYRVADGALIVDSGVINRRHREIPIARIHHVEEEAKLQHRLFGVVKLQIDSGGGESGAEVALDALGRSEAARLRAFLEGRPTAPGPIIDATTAAQPIASAGVGTLVIAGITNVPFAATIGVVGTLFQFADEIGDDFFYETVRRVPPTVTGFGAVVGAFAVLYVVAAGGASVLTNYGFTLQREGNELRTQRGLLDRRRAVVDLDKLTVIRLDETIMRRALRVCSMRLQTISGRGGGRGVSSLSIPLLERSGVDGVVSELMPVASPMPPLKTHPPSARRRIYVRRIVIALALGAPVAWLWRPTGLIVAGLLIALAACRAEVAYRALGHATRDGVLVSREGGLRRETAITAWTRAESTRLRSSPLQRWAGLASLYVDVPQGRSVSVADAAPGDLTELRKLALPARAGH